MAGSFATTPALEGVANSASTYVVTRSVAVQAGAVLCGYCWQYSATNTLTSVTDDLGGTYVISAVQRGNGGNENASLYAFYKLNSAAGGTPTNGRVTCTWSGAAQGGAVFAEIRGLAGGGALDELLLSLKTGSGVDPWIGPTGAISSAGAAALGFGISNVSLGSLGALQSGFLADAAPNGYYFASGGRLIAAGTEPVLFGATTKTTIHLTAGVMVFSDAASPPVINGPGGAQGAAAAVTISSGATAVHTYTANKPVGWTKNGGADQALFAINPATGALVFNSPAVAGNYVVTLRAAETANPAITTDQTLAVTVNPPAGGGTITSQPLVRNDTASSTGTWSLWGPGEAFTAWVHHRVTGALLVKRTGLLTDGIGVLSFTDPAVPAAPAYRVDFEHEATGVIGVDVLAAV